MFEVDLLYSRCCHKNSDSFLRSGIEQEVTKFHSRMSERNAVFPGELPRTVLGTVGKEATVGKVGPALGEPRC